MEKRIRIRAGAVEVTARLAANATAEAVYTALPIRAVVQTWGDEIYFEIPLHLPLDASAREEVEKGDLGYWPAGPAFCVFFGPTPASRGGEIRPASAVNVFGRVEGDATVLSSVAAGESVVVEPL